MGSSLSTGSRVACEATPFRWSVPVRRRRGRALPVEVETRRKVDERQAVGEVARLGRVVHPAKLADDRQVDPDERGDLARPDTGRADDRIRLDAPSVVSTRILFPRTRMRFTSTPWRMRTPASAAAAA